jgi:hypothetical protein
MNTPVVPCQFCDKPTTVWRTDGPICGTCLLAFHRGRMVGIVACIEQAKKHGATADVVDELVALL